MCCFSFYNVDETEANSSLVCFFFVSFFFQWYPVVVCQSSLKYVAYVTPQEGRLVIG